MGDTVNGVGNGVAVAIGVPVGDGGTGDGDCIDGDSATVGGVTVSRAAAVIGVGWSGAWVSGTGAESISLQ